MKSTLRRLSVVAGATTTVAVVASVLVAPSASAAITSISPPSAFNSETAREITINTNSSTDYRFGGSATLTLNGPTSATYTVPIQPSPSEDSPRATLNLADTGNGLGNDGPLDAGSYVVTTTATGAPVTGTGSGSDTCVTTCFTVQPANGLAPIVVASVAPGSLRAGESADVTITGDGFERRSRIDVLLPDGSAADTGITTNQVPVGAESSTTDADSTQGITTRTTLKRRFTVAAGVATGARDVRVTNLDGRSGVCVKCFSVNGAPLLGISSTGGLNDPAGSPVAITFSGTNLNARGVPVLLYTQDPGSSTREELTIVGRNVRNVSASSITADFDLRNAAPQVYVPVVRNPDGSTNACTCTYQVSQTPSRTTTVTSVDSSTATAGIDKSQAAGTTKSFVVTGTGFARGTRVTVSGTGVTTTAVEFLSDTQLRATFQSTPAAATGDRNVTATRTDGVTSAPCTACYTVTPGASPSPSASATPTSSATPSGSASASPDNDVERPTVSVRPSTIIAVEQSATVSGRSTPGATVEIYAYSRPNTEFTRVRSETVDDDGTYSFVVRPSGNTRLYAQTVTPEGTARSGSIVLTVKTSLNLKVARTGTQTYRFTGSLLPKRPNQLITVFYENPDGTRTIAARARNAADGTYNVTRRFTGTGTFTFFTGTGTDNNNAANDSNRVRVTVR